MSSRSPRAAADVTAPPAASPDYRVLLVAFPIGSSILAGLALDLPQVTTLGALVAVLTASVSPAAGLATLAFIAPFEPSTVFSPFGLNALLVAATIFGCVVRLPTERPHLRVDAILFLLSAFVVYAGVQQLPDMISGYPGPQSQFVGASYKQLLTGFGECIAAALVMTQRKPQPFLVAALASAGVAAVLTIVAPSGSVLWASLSDSLATATGEARAVGPFGNANYFGLFVATAITTAAGWMVWARSPRTRVLLFATCAALGVALALTLSRGAMVALAAGGVCLAFTRRRALGVAVAGTALVLVAVVYPAFADLRLGLTYGSLSADAYVAAQQSDAERLRAVLAGFDLFLSSPVFGVGFGQYHFLSATLVGNQFSTFPHDWYISVLAEQGTVGAVIWIAFLIVVVARLRLRTQVAKSIGFSVLAAYTVGSLFTAPPTAFTISALPLLVLVAALVGDWTTSTLRGGRIPTQVDVVANRPRHPLGRRSSW